MEPYEKDVIAESNAYAEAAKDLFEYALNTEFGDEADEQELIEYAKRSIWKMVHQLRGEGKVPVDFTPWNLKSDPSPL